MQCTYNFLSFFDRKKLDCHGSIGFQVGAGHSGQGWRLAKNASYQPVPLNPSLSRPPGFCSNASGKLGPLCKLSGPGGKWNMKILGCVYRIPENGLILKDTFSCKTYPY